jgi:hypothetical protein
MEGYDWLARQLPQQDDVLEQFKHIEDILIFEEDGSPLWAIRFRDLSNAKQVLERFDVEFVIGGSRVEASLGNLSKGFQRSKLVGCMVLEFPSEVEDIAGVAAISLVAFAQNQSQVVKISLVYARESK